MQRKRHSDVHYYITSRYRKMTFVIKLMTSQTCLFTKIETGLYILFLQQLWNCYLNMHLKFGVILSQTYKDMTLSQHMYQNVCCNLLQKKLHYTPKESSNAYTFVLAFLKKLEI